MWRCVFDDMWCSDLALCFALHCFLSFTVHMCLNVLLNRYKIHCMWVVETYSSVRRRYIHTYNTRTLRYFCLFARSLIRPLYRSFIRFLISHMPLLWCVLLLLLLFLHFSVVCLLLFRVFIIICWYFSLLIITIIFKCFRAGSTCLIHQSKWIVRRFIIHIHHA